MALFASELHQFDSVLFLKGGQRELGTSVLFDANVHPLTTVLIEFYVMNADLFTHIIEHGLMARIHVVVLRDLHHIGQE